MEKYGGKLIFTGEDERGVVEVVDYPFIRCLHFGTPIQQSSMYLADPFDLEMEYCKVMMLSLLFNPEPHKVLFLGLGGGAKQKFLWKHFPSCRIDAVEWSPLVIDAGYRHFSIPRDLRLNIHCSDALQFLQTSSRSAYDLLFVDLFLGDQNSPVVGHSEFFSRCRSALSENGLIILNTWKHGPQGKLLSIIENMKSSLQQPFFALPNSESPNIVWMNFPYSNSTMTLEDLTKNTAWLKEKTALDFPQLLKDQVDFSRFFSLERNTYQK